MSYWDEKLWIYNVSDWYDNKSEEEIHIKLFFFQRETFICVQISSKSILKHPANNILSQIWKSELFDNNHWSYAAWIYKVLFILKWIQAKQMQGVCWYNNISIQSEFTTTPYNWLCDLLREGKEQEKTCACMMHFAFYFA